MRKILSSIVVALQLLGDLAAGQTRLEQIPGYEHYKNLRDNSGGLVTGGTIDDVKWSRDGSAVTFAIGKKRLSFNLTTLTMADAEGAEEPPPDDSPEPRRQRRPGRGRQRDTETSPDGIWTARCKDFNVVLERVDGMETVPITSDGTRKMRYGQASWVYGEELDQMTAMWWSPDSSKLTFYAFDERAVNDFYLLSGWTELHTELLTEGYPKPGEPNPIAKLIICDLASRETLSVDVGDDPDQYIYDVRYTPDGTSLLYNRTNRRQNKLEVLAADLKSGVSRVIVTESQSTWQNNSPELRFLEDGKRFIWETERSGFKQYELRNLDGSLINPLTSDEYPVERITRVDEEAGVMWYTAFSDANPLSAQLHRVGLGGQGQTRLTQDDLHHTNIEIAPDGKWFIATSQAVDAPPFTFLYDSDGKRVATLAEPDTSKFKSLNLQMPELFSFKADDGTTDLYGVLYKPSDFDAAKKHPLVIDVYGGPLSRRVSNTFRACDSHCELGFLVAVIDNRGTAGRGKAFEGATYLKLGTVDLKDQADGVRFLARRPYVDGNRVGIYGSSYGGYLAALGILKHPDVFQVAVAGSAVTDWRNYDSIYTERFMWIPQENKQGYDDGSCMTFAHQLAGHLLILHGMRDDNVHPNNAWQLIDALQRGGKRFDMAWFPNGGHGTGSVGSRMQWEFLYEHLIAHPTQPQPTSMPSPVQTYD